MTRTEAPQLPTWIREPFVHFLKHTIQAHDFYHLSIDGILMIIHNVRRIEELTAELEKLEKESNVFTKDQRPDDGASESARKRAEIAQKEADRGFPILNQQVSVGLWASLECLVREFVAGWLANEPGASQVDSVRKIKIRLADYDAMPEEERRFYIIDELEREIGAPLRQGVNRFESLLGLFGLSGEVDEGVRRQLFELSQLRNVIVHRRGVADMKLTESCPWLGLEIGQEVIINSESFHRYFDAACKYESVLLDRVKRIFGVHLDESDASR